jgi:uncharacterized protein with von Willebrand factor type A (vWA) domain
VAEEEDELVEPYLYDYVFIIDRSGSMDGEPIQLASLALQVMVQSLPYGSKFNIVSFGSNHEFMFEQSVEYNEQNLHTAINKLKGFKANFGGTEILAPIRAVI